MIKSFFFNSLTKSLWPVCGLLGIVVLLQPQAATAQAGKSGAMLEEIVTVARKRSDAEVAQDVPIALTAYGADQLAALFVKKLDDLSYQMPNVQLEAVGTFPGVQNFSIRGQGINSSIPSVDPTVGVFVDGVYLGTTYGVVVDTFDLESVEVLRGPQGLLFGRNVTGGAVILRNKLPTGEFGAKVRMGYDDDNESNIAAAIEAPLIEDILAAKVVMYMDNDPGYFTNNNQSAALPAPHPFQPFYIDAATRSKVGKFDTTIIRPSFLYTPSDTQRWTLIVEGGRSEGDGAVWTNVTTQRAGLEDEFTTTADEIGFTDITWSQAVLETNVDEIYGGTLTNILGWREVDAQSAADIDGTANPIFSAPGDTQQDQISDELRWSGNFTDNWSATLGLYWFEQDVYYREARYIWLPPPLGPPPFGVNLQRALGGDMTTRNFGVFWNNDFYLNEAFTLSAGLRYTEERKSAQIITGTCTDNINFDCTFDDLKGDWDNLTPKLGIQWNLNDDAQLFAFWSKGFRSGGFNFRNAKPNLIPPGPTREEESDTYEIGFKSDLADGRMRLNISAFYNDITDMQRELNVGDPDVIVLQATLNAGDVTIKGVELDFVWAPINNLSLFASGGWQDGEYDSYTPLVLQLTAAYGTTIIGPELPRLAPVNYNVGFSWDLPMGSAGLLNFTGNYAYREGHPYNDSNTELFDDQTRTNAALNWYSPDDSWRVSLYGKNLGDEANWGNLTSIAGLYTAGPMQKGRTMGLEVAWQYQ
ncbi:MAG TPA: TonB-dependent receptor [Woeseiaceae bacterium]|nr:TonB-dependent receptor [Woeseiaceae bacterium]